MPSFGEKLKQEREKRKITLEQISSSTKIGTRMLQALEEDKFDQLPGGIFNKGFVRAYSHCVGLDEDQTVAEYLQASGDAPPVRTEGGHEAAGHETPGHEDRTRERENEQTVRRLEAISDTPTRPLPWGLFAALLLLIALALSLWSHRQRERARQSLRPVPPAAALPVPSAASGGASGVTSDGSRAGSPANTSPAPSLPMGEPTPSTAPKIPQVPAATASPGEFTVVIQAREESWISITADGKTTASELLAAGGERTARGKKEVVVKAGNAGAIDFRFNGRKVDAGGQYGEVKTVTFGPGGMSPKTPAPPPTP